MSSPRLEESMSVFGASPLVDLLPESVHRELASHVRYAEFERGQTIFARGASGSDVYWVVTGRVKVMALSLNGNELLHSMVEPGEYFGEVSAVDGRPRGIDATAESRTGVLALSRDHLLPALERHPPAALRLAELLCVQIRLAGETLQDFVFYSSQARIWSHLLRLVDRYGSVERDNGSIRIEHRLSQEDLAHSVGLTRVMVNRQLAAWRDLGLIEYGRGFIVIHDKQTLDAHVGMAPDTN